MKSIKSISVLIVLLIILAFNSTKAQKQDYDVAAFYWPAYHYEPRLEFIFPEKKGEWEIIYHAKPNVTVSWDANPRFIFKTGYITNSTPDKFAKYLTKAKAYADEHPDQKKLIAINAWNEWSEGSYLEPDTLHGMKYLEAIKKVLQE